MAMSDNNCIQKQTRLFTCAFFFNFFLSQHDEQQAFQLITH